MLLLKRFLLVVTAALILAQNASGFALLGPRDTWQVSTLGFDPQADGGDLGGPKNLGEEWRWQLPVITYAFDDNFIDFFGLNGIAAVSNAFALFNREMTDLGGLTFAQLKAKPRETRRLHSTAQALGLLDLKSYAMSLIAEQLGLASPERSTWILRSRNVPGPNITNYVVLQRNYDPFTYKPTPYVNGIRYSYQVKSYPAASYGADFESTSVFPVRLDEAERAVTVAGSIGEDFTSSPPLLGVPTGVYYAALTQDDIGGLKYIYSRDNVNNEDVIPGVTNRIVDTRSLVYLQGTDAYLFFTNAVLNSPSNLLAQFPALNFALNTNVLVIASNIITTNVFITNFVSSGLFTNYAALTVLTNDDLFGLSEFSRTNAGGALLARYPGLIISTTNTFPELITNEVYFLTNFPWMPVGSASVVATNYVKDIGTRYQYTYSNVRTNYKSSVSDVEVQTITTTTAGLLTNRALIKNTNKTSGGFLIIDRTGANANLVDYSTVDANGVPLLRVTNVVQVANVIANAPLAGFLKLGINTFTNVTYAAYPILLNALSSSVVVTNFTITPVTRYLYSLTNFTAGDPVTGLPHFVLVPSDTNLLQSVQIGANGNSNLIVQTIDLTDPANPKISNTIIGSQYPQGVALIYDPTQFVLNGAPIITSGLTTNIITQFTDPASGRSFTQLLIYQTNSALFPANPILLQAATGALRRGGVNSVQFKQMPYRDFLNQANETSTNFYETVTLQDGIPVRSTFMRVAGPDILISAGDLGVSSGGFPFPVSRSIAWQSGTTQIVPPTQFDEGPGIVVPGATFNFSTIIPYNFNSNPNFIDEQNSEVFFGWGSFDSRTVTPRLYPEDINTQVTLELLEALALYGRTLR